MPKLSASTWLCAARARILVLGFISRLREIRRGHFAGKIANDTTNRVIAAYLEGLFGPVDSEGATRLAIAQLMPDGLHDQFCFLSPRAVECLEFVEARRYGR